MANYINKTILSESYAHIEVEELSVAEKKEFEMDIKAYQGPRAKRMLGADIEPMVRTEDGSLKVYLTICGSLTQALGDFDDFREALQVLYMSSKMVADACNLESLFLAGGVKKNLIRAEARTGVVKATKELYDRALFLGTTQERMSQRRIATTIAELEKKTTVLNKNLTIPKDRVLVWENLEPLFVKLPASVHRLQLNVDEDATKIHRSNLNSIVRQIQDFKKKALAHDDTEL